MVQNELFVCRMLSLFVPKEQKRSSADVDSSVKSDTFVTEKAYQATVLGHGWASQHLLPDIVNASKATMAVLGHATTITERGAKMNHWCGIAAEHDRLRQACECRLPVADVA